jgi:hypothetical protein
MGCLLAVADILFAVLELAVIPLELLHLRERRGVPEWRVWPKRPKRSKIEVACWRVFWTLLTVVVIGSVVYLVILDLRCNAVAAGAP